MKRALALNLISGTWKWPGAGGRGWSVIEGLKVTAHWGGACFILRGLRKQERNISAHSQRQKEEGLTPLLVRTLTSSQTNPAEGLKSWSQSRGAK